MSRKPSSRVARTRRGSSQTAIPSFETPRKFFDEQEKAKRIFKEKQKAMFALLAVKRNGKERKMSAVKAYLSLLNQEAARGETSASRELRYLEKQREKTEHQRREEQARVDSQIASLYEKQKRLARIGNLLGGAIYLGLLPGIWHAFAEVKGPLTFSDSLVLPGLDPSIAAKQIKKLQRRKQRQNPKPETDLGFGKPPKEGQFQPGKSGNEKGRRPQAGVWDELQDDLLEVVWVTRSIKRERSTKAAVGVTQLFQRAMAGESTARRALRQEIIDLDNAGLLEPPAVEKRSKKIVDPLATELSAKAIPQVVQTMKQQMIDLFSRRFDCTVPHFTTDFERSLGIGPEAAKPTMPLPPSRRRTSKLQKEGEKGSVPAALKRARDDVSIAESKSSTTSGSKKSALAPGLSPGENVILCQKNRSKEK